MTFLRLAILSLLLTAPIGCAPRAVFVPAGAPLKLSAPTVTQSPYYRQDGKWVQANGPVILDAGTVDVALPATQP